MKSIQALRVLRGYRRALRATEKVFAGDENIEVARSYVRDQFRARVDETDRDLIGTGEKICSHTYKHSSNTHTHTLPDEHIGAIDEAVNFALENVVQAKPNEKGHLEVEVNSNTKDDHIILGTPDESSPE